MNQLTEDQKELLKAANLYPQTSKQKDKIKKLLKSTLTKNLDLQSNSSSEGCIPRNSSSFLKNGKTTVANCINISCSSESRRGSGLTKNGDNKNSQSMSQLQKVKEGLKACKGDKGVFNPRQAFDCLNEIQKQQDPEAY